VVTVPADLSHGTHRIIVQDTSGAVLGWTEITVTGSTVSGAPARGLAATGIDLAPWLAGGLLLVVIGAALVVRNRISRKS
jgi:hypothetical protein